jgi:hypothetical protein
MLPAYNPTEHLPPPVDLLPTLTVNSKGRVYLSQALVQRLGIRNAQPANLLPPSNGSKFWHLDLRPVAPRWIKWYDNTRPRIEYIQLPNGLVLPQHPLTLQLLPGEPAFAGFYPLLPDADFTHRQAPALAA